MLVNISYTVLGSKFHQYEADSKIILAVKPSSGEGKDSAKHAQRATAKDASLRNGG